MLSAIKMKGSNCMNDELKELRAEDYNELIKYFNFRYSHTCENILVSHFIWKDYYHTRYIADENGLFWIFQVKDEIFTLMPYCKEEDLEKYLYKAKDYFNNVLGRKLVIYLADEKAVTLLDLPEDKFLVEEDRRYFDYIYCAESLRNLKGKKFHKKKNHINAFLKAYGDRYEYKALHCGHQAEIMRFLRRWEEVKNIEDEYNRIDYELNGIEYLLHNCQYLNYKMCGIYIDGELEAFSLGVYGKTEKMAVVHVEKANPNIRGLYPFINQQFQMNEFPEAMFVNREDDMGLEGLRKAKMSYHPIYLMEKYNVFEK